MNTRKQTITAESLRQLPGFSRFTIPQLDEMAKNLTVKSIKRNEIIFAQGDPADLVYVLLSGIARLSLVNEEGRQVLITLLAPGEVLGIGAFVFDKRHPIRCDAFSQCTVGMLKPETFIVASTGLSSGAFFSFMEVTMGRVWKMLLHCTRGIGLTLRKRLALELLELAASFGTSHTLGTILALRPRHEDLANAIGASRQRVSECLADFARERAVIREPGRFIIVPAKLRAIVERESGEKP